MNFARPFRTAFRAFGVTLAIAALVSAPVGNVGSIALAEKGGKGDGGGGKKGGGGDQNLPVCITFGAGAVTHDGLNFGKYCSSEFGVTAFVGRTRSITFELKSNQSRTLLLTLGSRLADVVGDPDPNNDGGTVGGDWSNHPLPVLPADGIVGSLEVAYQVNVLRMGEPSKQPNPNFRNARLTFDDASGKEWRLLWGPHPSPGGSQFTNPAAPPVRVTRRVDGSGNLIDEWDVTTLGDSDLDRTGAATAFLMRRSKKGPSDYWGAFDVSFLCAAVEDK